MASGTVVTGQVEASVAASEDAHVIRLVDLSAFGLAWEFDSSTTASDPGAGIFRYDNVTVGSIANLYVNATGKSGLDLQEVLASLLPDDMLLIQPFVNSSSAILFKVDDFVTDNSGWFTIPVSVLANNGNVPSDGAYCGVVLCGQNVASGS